MRPFYISVFSLAAIIYYGIPVIMSLIMMVMPAFFTRVLDHYWPSEFQILMTIGLSFIVFILNIIPIIGVLLIRKGKWVGFYLFSVANILLITSSMFFLDFNIVALFIYFIFFVVFGLSTRHLT